MSSLSNYAESGGTYEGKRRNRFLTLTELRVRPMPKPIIDGLLYSNQEHVVFGPQGGSKTAVMLDLALHCVNGKQWLGRETSSGKIIYVCGEGGGKVLANRIDAWVKYHGIEDISLIDDLLRVTEFPVHMLDGESVDEFVDMLRQEGDALLIIVDTLSANFGSGDENSVSDMGKFLNAIRAIRLQTDAGVCVVHHTGHHDQSRPQGSNKIRRDVDIELLVNRDIKDENLFGILGGGTLKNRNGPGCGMIAYRLHEVTLDERDHFGNPLSSIVVVSTDDEPKFEPTKAQRRGRGKNQVAVLKALRVWATAKEYDLGSEILVTPADWTEVYKAARIPKQRANDVKTSLTEAGIFRFAVGGFVWEPDSE